MSSSSDWKGISISYRSALAFLILGIFVTQVEQGSVTTILLSHNLDTAKGICHKIFCLHGGEVRTEGDPGKVVKEYMTYLR
jgi:ABC-type multidrug transport system ATPase subunit